MLLNADDFLVNVHSKICLPFSLGELNHEISFKTLRQMFGSSPVMGITKSIKGLTEETQLPGQPKEWGVNHSGG